jgi:hypothetical protein
MFERIVGEEGIDGGSGESNTAVGEHRGVVCMDAGDAP